MSPFRKRNLGPDLSGHLCGCGRYGSCGIGSRWYCRACVPASFWPAKRIDIPAAHAKVAAKFPETLAALAASEDPGDVL